jgi:Cu2+-exporting ATPase
VVGVSVPFVLILSALTVAYWAQSMPFDRALLIGLAVLVVACPCAVGLAAPLATSLGIGRLSRSGCLVRDPGALEALARTRFLAFDKTGTLTSGIESDGVAPAEVLARAAGLEVHSEHGLARAITMAAAARGLKPVVTSDIRAMPGRGIRGSAGSQLVAAGNGALMSELGWSPAPDLAKRARALEGSGHSVIYVGWGGEVHAALSLDDTPLPEARSTVEALHSLGLHVALLSGDLAPAAQRVAGAVGIDDMQAGLPPDAKRTALDQYRGRYKTVAMVGDGLNDGPVLADADVGIAVGSATDLARETASLVLPKDGLSMLPWVIAVARAVRKTIVTNLMWAFGYNLVALTLAALGILQPVLAAAIMASSSLLLVVNSLRLSRLPDPAPLGIPERPPSLEPDSVRRGLGVPVMAGSAIERG